MITINVSATVHVIDDELAFVTIRCGDCPAASAADRSGFIDLSILPGGSSLDLMKELLNTDLNSRPLKSAGNRDGL